MRQTLRYTLAEHKVFAREGVRIPVLFGRTAHLKDVPVAAFADTNRE
jgi:hypothetical protein